MVGIRDDRESSVTVSAGPAGVDLQSLPPAERDRLEEQLLRRWESQVVEAISVEDVSEQCVERVTAEVFEEHLSGEGDVERAAEVLQRIAADPELADTLLRPDHVHDHSGGDRQVTEPIDERPPWTAVWRHRQAVFYGVALSMLILALRLSSLPVAVAGGTLLVLTALHYGD